MHKIRAFSNITLAFTLLFSILFHSVHSIEHLVDQITTEKCLHAASYSKIQITHDHHHIEKCPICDFTFSPFLDAKIQSFSIVSNALKIPYFYFTTSGFAYEIEEISTLRGPPQLIV